MEWYPTYDGSTYDFLTLWWCKSDMHSVEAVLQILIFSWASDLKYDTCSGC